MATKNKRAKLIASTLFVGVLGTLAVLPSASASVTDGGFGVQSVNSDDSTITAFAGMKAPEATPGTGGGGTTPPVECKVTTIADPGNFPMLPYPSDFVFLHYAPVVKGGAANQYSDWVNQIQASGGTITGGEGQAYLTENYDGSGARLDFDKKNTDILPAVVVPKGTLDKSKLTAATSAAADYGTFKVDIYNARGEIAEAWQGGDIHDRIDESGKSYSDTVRIDYPLTVKWPAGANICDRTVTIVDSTNSVAE